MSGIWNYTLETWSERQADLYYNMLIGLCGDIADDPLRLGKRYEQIDGNILGYRAASHVIFYRILSDSEIEVVRILHGSMDLKNRIRE